MDIFVRWLVFIGRVISAPLFVLAATAFGALDGAILWWQSVVYEWKLLWGIDE